MTISVQNVFVATKVIPANQNHNHNISVYQNVHACNVNYTSWTGFVYLFDVTSLI